MLQNDVLYKQNLLSVREERGSDEPPPTGIRRIATTPSCTLDRRFKRAKVVSLRQQPKSATAWGVSGKLNDPCAALGCEGSHFQNILLLADASNVVRGPGEHCMRMQPEHRVFFRIKKCFGSSWCELFPTSL